MNTTRTERRSRGAVWRWSAAGMLLSFVLLPPGSEAEDCLRAVDYLKKGVALSDSSSTEERFYRDAIAMCEALSEAHYNLALLHFDQGKYQDAERGFTAAIGRRKTPESYIGRGNALLKLGELEQAEKMYKKAAELEKDSLDVAHGLSVVHAARGELEKAADVLAQASKKAPESAKLLFNLGVIYEKMNRTDDALLSYERAVAKSPLMHQAALRAASVYRRKGANAKARKVLEASRRARPNEPALLLGLAELSVSLGEPDAALVFLDGIPPQASLDTDKLLNMAVVLVKAGEVESGIELLHSIAEQEPDNAAIHGALGWAYIKVQEWEAAKAELDKAVKLSAEDAFAHNNLGVLYEMQGDLAAAKTEYSLAIQYAPDNPQAKQNLARVRAKN